MNYLVPYEVQGKPSGTIRSCRFPRNIATLVQAIRLSLCRASSVEGLSGFV